jgi:cellulose synthase (UDP-forming)
VVNWVSGFFCLRLPTGALSALAGFAGAAAPIVSWLGSLASYRGFAFKPSFGDIPMDNAVVFLNRNGAMPELGLSVTGPSAAMVPNPRDKTGTLLVIMGRDKASGPSSANASLRPSAG